MRIDPALSEWLNLIVRWIHIFTAILWIGQTWLFMWLDGELTREEDSASKRGEPAQVWMVHSGGFYVVEKRKAAELTRKLHWFRWEAALTWLSGMFLLVLLYYMGGALVELDGILSVRTATLLCLGLLVVAWIVYDILCHTPLVKHDLLFAAVAFLFVVGITYGLTKVLSARAAYIHVGAMFGTIMTVNVWNRILPSQKRMIAAMREGKALDPTLAAGAKQRSKHNTFMVVPLIFTMISNHFPTATLGHEYNWVILSALVLLGWGAAAVLRKVV